MNTPRVDPHAVRLTDGRVLVVGDDQSAELWDPDTGEWTVTAGLNNPRTGFALVALADGRALITGGMNDRDESYSSAYVFDPHAETWTKVELMDTARADPMAALLPDGRVLTAGGYFRQEPSWEGGSAPRDIVLAAYRPGTDTHGAEADIPPMNVGAAMATAEIFDPATGVWSSTGAMQYARRGSSITTLGDGRVLVVGTAPDLGEAVGVDPQAPVTAEVYDPDTGQFTVLNLRVPPLTGEAAEIMAGSEFQEPPLATGTLVPLADGHAALIGTEGGEKHGIEVVMRSYRLDVGTGQMTEIGEARAFRENPSSGEAWDVGEQRWNAVVAGLPADRILVAGGRDGLWGPSSEPITTSELLNPHSGTLTPLPDMPQAREDATPVVLADGSVLLIGGQLRQRAADTVTDTALASVVRLRFLVP